MSIIKKNPKRRFKECNDDWERRKVGDTITDVSRPVELKDNELYQLVTVKRRNEGIVSRGKLLGKDILVKNYYEVCAGDYVISKRQLIHGANGVIPQELDKSVVSNEYMVCVSNDKITAEFLGWLSKTPGLKRDFFLSSYGVDVEKMVFNADDWKKRYLTIPSVDEQNKITSYLSNLDNLIALHQRKLDKLTGLKKAYLSEMFPAPGEKKPRRRFPGFTGYWEQRKLGDVIEDMYNGQTPSRFKDNYWGGEICWLSSGELNRGTVYQSKETITVEGQKSANLRLVPKGTFVMAITGLEAAGTRGNCAILGFDTTLNQSCMALFPNKDLLDTKFLFQWYKLVGERYGITYTQGTKQQSYNAEIVSDLDICLPPVNEQQKIADVLGNLDNLIDLHQRKLDKLMALKRAYLAEMFV